MKKNIIFKIGYIVAVLLVFNACTKDESIIVEEAKPQYQSVITFFVKGNIIEHRLFLAHCPTDRFDSYYFGSTEGLLLRPAFHNEYKDKAFSFHFDQNELCWPSGKIRLGEDITGLERWRLFNFIPRNFERNIVDGIVSGSMAGELGYCSEHNVVEYIPFRATFDGEVLPNFDCQ